jgi:hypothetical protein
MTLSADAERPFPARRAFVVQFSAQANVAMDKFAGRIEHVVTGHVRRFQTLEELLVGLVQMLDALGTTPPEEGEEADCSPNAP